MTLCCCFLYNILIIMLFRIRRKKQIEGGPDIVCDSCPGVNVSYDIVSQIFNYI